MTTLPPERTPGAVWFVYFLWVLILFDPHRWIAAHGFGIAARTGTFSFLPVAVLIALAGPGFLDRKRSWVWFAPLLMFIVAGFLTIPMSMNRGASFDMLKPLIIYFMLATVTCMTIKTPRQAVPIVVMLFLGQFVWWHLHGGFLRGFVQWHPLLSNTDGYGPLMVMGMALAFYFGLATPRHRKKLRWFAFATAGLCVIGITASFARGAFIGAVSVAGMVLLRSPHKGRTLGAFVAGGIVLAATAKIMFPSGAFWNEMATIFTEGKDAGTGQDRWVLWGMAVEVFLSRPIFGAGMANFGTAAADLFDVGAEAAGHYGVNPGKLVGRSLHSMYFQILSEMGIAGVLTFGWMVVDFVKRNRALRSPTAISRWNVSTGGKLDFRVLSYGLEAGAVGCLLTATLYAAYLYVHWVFTLFILNRLLFGLTVGSAAPGMAVRAGAAAAPSDVRPFPCRPSRQRRPRRILS